jgi:protein-tyrosine phosphatase
VKLKVPDGQQDYINASPIALTASQPDGTRQADRYIAMQGPNEATSGHVWRMVTEQLTSPGVIVMLTQTHEANLEKCYQYFPKRIEDPPLEINEHDEFGDGFRASVRCDAIEETPAGAAIELRKLVVRIIHDNTRETAKESAEEAPMTPPQTEDGDSVMLSPQQRANGSKRNSPDTNVSEQILKRLSVNSQQDTLRADSASDESHFEERVVWHFLFKKWPDFGVPALEDLDSFFTLMRLSRERNSNPDNPRIVHCSAGVGRSGTFIALEHLMRELEDGVLEHWDSRPPSSNGGGSRPNDEPIRNAEDTPLAAVSEKDDLIFTVVNQLREQRRHMVQAEAQYLFLYQVMRKLWQDKYGALEEDERAAKRLEVDPFVQSA